MIHQTLMDIAQSGILAPSADNQHVFQIEIEEGTIQLWPSPEFGGNMARHRLILGLMSLGATVENMRLRACELGLGTQVTWRPADSAGPIAVLDFSESTPAQDLDLVLAKAIPIRHTNRRMYHGPRLTEYELAQLNAAATSISDVRLHWLYGESRRIALGTIWRAESERFLRQQLHEEIFSSIRFDLSWNESADIALPPGSLGIEPPMRPLFKALRHWSIMKPLTWIGMHHLIGLRAGWLPCWQAPGLAVLTTNLSPELGAAATGAAFQRIWLRATGLKLALQPLAASAVLPMRTCDATGRGASEQLQLRLMAGWKQICPDAKPMMVFRIGRAAQPRIRAGRRTLDQYLKYSSTQSNRLHQ